MKTPYVRPVLVKRQSLSNVTAVAPPSVLAKTPPDPV
jgi:hypothetical protein